MTWEFSLAGLLVGVLVGLTGMGGGSLMTPILVILFGFNPTLAVGTDVLHGAVFKTFGAARHRTLGTVHARLAGWMLLGSAPMSLLGVWLATFLRRHYGAGVQSVEGKAVGVALIAGGLGFAIKTFVTSKKANDRPFILARRDRLTAAAIGVTCGFVVGLTSVGSGTFFGLLMLLIFPLTAAKIVGTDIFHAAALLWVAGVGHLVAGNVNLHATAWLLVGSIPGVLIGSQLTLKVPERSLRIAFSIVLTLSGIKLVDVPGAKVILPVVLGVGIVALGGVLLRERAGRQRARHERPAAQQRA